MFKGRNTENEGELLFVDHNNLEKGEGIALNVFTDLYNFRLEEEITKLLKKKEKMKEF